MRALLPILVALPAGFAMAAGGPEVPLWPREVPEPKVTAAEPERVDRSGPGTGGFALRRNVTLPRLEVFAANASKRTGAACVVVPGGGFGILADEHEGSEACQWLASQGVAAFLLRHRCPTDKHPEPNTGPVQDCQRALMLVRERAAEWQVDPKKTGLLGFSAGGQVALVAATNGAFFALDGAVQSHRPDFLLLLYPWQLYDGKSKDLRGDVHIDGTLPPLFIAQAGNDKSSLAQGSTLVFLRALEARDAARVPTELHIYADGGHGFGMRPDKNGAPAPADWPIRAAAWLRAQGFAKQAGP